ncbi:MAG: FecR domain-containing protein, partial [Phenylobacterium sp.]
LRPPRWRARHVGQAVAAVLALAVAGAAVWNLSGGQAATTSARTDVGEQRTAALPDGSVVTLNVVTQIDYRIAADRRQVWIRDGEAMFFVHKDAERPFLVHAGSTDIRAIGTAFNVRRRDGATEVAVLDGIVSVTTSRPGAVAQSVRLVAGQKLRLQDGAGPAPPTVQLAAPQTIAEWRLRTVTYEDATLADVVRDVNRFYPRQLAVEDPELARRRVTLRLQVEDRQQTLDTLGALVGAELRERGGTDLLVAAS